VGSYGRRHHASNVAASRSARAVRAGAGAHLEIRLQISRLDPNNLVGPAGDPDGVFPHQLAAQGVFKLEWDFRCSFSSASGNETPAQGRRQLSARKKLASGDPTTVAGLPCLGYPSCGSAKTYATLVCPPATPTAAGLRRLVQTLVGWATILRTRLRRCRRDAWLQGQSDNAGSTRNDGRQQPTLAPASGGLCPVAMIWNSGRATAATTRCPGECESLRPAVPTGPGPIAIWPVARAPGLVRFAGLRGDASVDTGPGFAYYTATWISVRAGCRPGLRPSNGQAPRIFRAHGAVTFLLSRII